MKIINAESLKQGRAAATLAEHLRMRINDTSGPAAALWPFSISLVIKVYFPLSSFWPPQLWVSPREAEEGRWAAGRVRLLRPAQTGLQAPSSPQTRRLCAGCAGSRASRDRRRLRVASLA